MSNANEPDSVNTGALATTIAIVAFSTLGIALFVTSLVRDESRTLGDARKGTQERGVRELRADQLGVLEASPSWKDRAAGVVTLPIERAMDWMVEAVRKDPKALSPWQPPAPEALGGAGPEGAEAPAGTGGAAADAPPAADAAPGVVPAKAGAPAPDKTTPPAKVTQPASPPVVPAPGTPAAP
jgi:hypothetical protein